MNKNSRFTVGLSIVSICLMTTAITAGTIDGLADVSGGGFVLLDEDENVVEPGINAVTGAVNNDDFLGNGFSPNGVENCLRASVVDAGCAEGQGAGNRYKLFLTNSDPLDLTFGTSASSGITEYFNFGKMSNTTGARIVGAQLVLGTGTGDDFAIMDPANPATAALFDELVEITSDKALEWPFLDGATDGQSPLQRVFLPGGLFGDGGAEGFIGFFSEDRAGMIVTSNEDLNTLLAEALANDAHEAHFGDALLSRTMIPDGYFWDETVLDDADEDSLIAWYDYRASGGDGGWVWGALAEAESEDLATRLSDLADALGVEVDDLGYDDGAEIPANIVALMNEDSIFTEGPIEDLSNLNLNFNIDVGDIVIGEFTLRVVPMFAPIVEVSDTPFQFAVAGTLDAANVPFLNVDEAYLDVIDDVLELKTEEQQQAALASLGYGLGAASVGLAQDFGSDVIFSLSRMRSAADQGVVSKDAGSWAVGDGVTGFVNLAGGITDHDATENNPGYDSDRFGLIGGFETALNPSWSAGLVLGWHEGDADIDNDLGSVSAEGFSIAGHGRLQLSANAQLGFVLGYQDLSYDSTRNIVFGEDVVGTATGSTDAKMYFAGLQGQALRDVSWGRLGPVGSLEYYNLSVDGYTETGADIYNLAIEDYDSDLVIGRLGIRAELSERGLSNGWLMSAYGQAGLAARSGDGFTLNAAFDGANLPTMALPVDGGDSDWFELGLGMTLSSNMTSQGGTIVGVDYRGAFASGTQSHQGKIQISWVF